MSSNMKMFPMWSKGIKFKCQLLPMDASYGRGYRGLCFQCNHMWNPGGRHAYDKV